MAVKYEIEVVIGPDGTVVMETHGMKGAKCDEELAPILKALGEVKSSQKTSEAFERPTVNRQNTSNRSSS